MKRILIVDDDAHIRMLLEDHITDDLEYEAELAEDGAQAVEMVTDRPPDLVLMDVRMPRMDGITAIREMRKDENLAVVPIILLSAETDKNRWVEAFQAGANDFVPKPFSKYELLARINAHLKVADLTREVAKKNAILEADQQLAKSVQKQLMPRHFDFAGLAAASHYQAQEKIGGDFYDAWESGPRVNFVMGDISGHGASSALIMAVCKGLLHPLCESRRPVNEVVTEMNRRLCALLDDGDLDMFVTMVLASIDREENRLSVISAGHVPSYLITDKGIQTLSATGPALGFLSDYDYQAAEHRFGPSDTLVVYTDGLTEARNDHDELFGEDRLVKEVGGGGQPADIISRTLGRVMDFCQGQVSDDMAILAVRRQD